MFPAAELLDSAGRAFHHERQKPCWRIPNWTITCSTAITTARSGTSWRQTSAQQRQAIAKLAEHYGIMFFYRGQDPIDGQAGAGH
ncbi:conjugal transfer protein TraF (plasmid) [Escherichia coli]